MYKLMSLLVISAALSIFASESRCNFRVRINNEINDLKIFSIFVMPGLNIDLKNLSDEPVKVNFNGNFLLPKNGYYTLKAPVEKGKYNILIFNGKSDSMLINVFVKVPLSQKKGEYLNGYRIGNYPLIPLNNDHVYERPKGLIEVTENDLDTRLTPNFILGDFICKQEGGFPKYVLIREKLLLKLEYLTEILKEKNINISKFKFISAYRTPFYNKLIGNVKYSRHIYGGAADMYIDEDSDGRMDDLNKDGKLDHGDAQFLFKTIEEHSGAESFMDFIGGLGLYKRTEAHPSFIHIDTRGFKARW
ncbi:MAG: hypothetical protein JXN63_04675 [Candidatus Delongbacteria bacterium]|nr:hypothetical protein [Candidatus Delongbacteria bacterium]